MSSCELTRSEKDSMSPGLYTTNSLQFARSPPMDPSIGIMGSVYGGVPVDRIAMEDQLMLRTTVVSKCGRVSEKVANDEAMWAAARAADEKPLPPAGDNSIQTPLTQWLHRTKKACTPESTITNDRIADRSLLLHDPFTSVRLDQFYAIPVNSSQQMRDSFVQCRREGPSSSLMPAQGETL